MCWNEAKRNEAANLIEEMVFNRAKRRKNLVPPA